ncbi:MAG TPA: ribonucleoside-diphosphate reductase subunit alpha [Verrucomicrobia bacterium]|nr:ribonucleoside-diphosphate reductase subunit alpha [Verrucomicrobiota bacterium]
MDTEKTIAADKVTTSIQRAHESLSTLMAGLNDDALQLIRRNGQVVPWNEQKIEIAVRKAFLSQNMDSSYAKEISREVSERIQTAGLSFVNIEDVQDCVQEALMRRGYFKVAEAYILYRSARKKIREEAAQRSAAEDKRQDAIVFVKCDDGQSFFWNGVDLRKRILFSKIGLPLNLSDGEIENEVRSRIPSETTAHDLRKQILKNATQLATLNSHFSFFAARMQLSYLYEDVLGWNIVDEGTDRLKAFHQKYFRDYIRHGIQNHQLDKRLQEFNLDRLTEAIDVSADLDIDSVALATLLKGHLKTSVNKVLETPQIFWMRVAMGLCLNESHDREVKAIQLYSLLKSRRICFGSPILISAGTDKAALANAYVYKVSDSLESIMHRGIAENAFLSKKANSIGGAWTAVRGKGCEIHDNMHGCSEGILPFLKLHSGQLEALNRGFKGPGKGCAYVEIWHNDILSLQDFNKKSHVEPALTCAQWIPDLFFQRLQKEEDWTLFRSNEVPGLHKCFGSVFEAKYCEYENRAEEGEIFGHKVPAKSLWQTILNAQIEKNFSRIAFKDACNLRNTQKHTGCIHASDALGDVTLNSGEDETAPVFSGFVLLPAHINKNGNLEMAKLKESLYWLVRALDNAIDIHTYPSESARMAAKRHRAVSIGVMGLQEALYLKNLAYDSYDGIEFHDELAESLEYFALESSQTLSQERSSYPSYGGSLWEQGQMPLDTLDTLERERKTKIDVPRHARLDWNALRNKILANGLRNSHLVALGSDENTAKICGLTDGPAPTLSNLVSLITEDGTLRYLHPLLFNELQRVNLADVKTLEQIFYFDGNLTHVETLPADLKKKYRTANELDPNLYLQAAAQRQKWLDQSQVSLPCFSLPSVQALSSFYLKAWKLGLKTFGPLLSL